VRLDGHPFDSNADYTPAGSPVSSNPT
jgi:hypothetical protein